MDVTICPVCHIVLLDGKNVTFINIQSHGRGIYTAECQCPSCRAVVHCTYYMSENKELVQDDFDKDLDKIVYEEKKPRKGCFGKCNNIRRSCKTCPDFLECKKVFWDYVAQDGKRVDEKLRTEE